MYNCLHVTCIRTYLRTRVCRYMHACIHPYILHGRPAATACPTCLWIWSSASSPVGPGTRWDTRDVASDAPWLPSSNSSFVTYNWLITYNPTYLPVIKWHPPVCLQVLHPPVNFVDRILGTMELY